MTEDKQFIVILEPEENGGFSVHCPAVNCASQGDTREEALAMIADAVQGLLEIYDEEKDRNPALVPLPLAETPELIAQAVKDILEFRIEGSQPLTLEIIQATVSAPVPV